MPNFQNLLVLAFSTDENNPIHFSKPAPEASPVLTLGKDSKGQVRTKSYHVEIIDRAMNLKIGGGDKI